MQISVEEQSDIPLRDSLSVSILISRLGWTFQHIHLIRLSKGRSNFPKRSSIRLYTLRNTLTRVISRSSSRMITISVWKMSSTRLPHCIRTYRSDSGRGGHTKKLSQNQTKELVLAEFFVDDIYQIILFWKTGQSPDEPIWTWLGGSYMYTFANYDKTEIITNQDNHENN